MPSGPGVISDQRISEISKSINNKTDIFLLTSETIASKIIQQHEKFNTNTIQMVDKLEKDNYQELRDKMPNVELVQVIHVLDENSIKEAIRVEKYVDKILLDSGNPNQKIKTLGGTGNVHNWEISRSIRELVNVPVYLAGGLNSSNIKEAIETVQPYGVDLCSGVRTNGKLDVEKLRMFFKAIKK